MALAKNPPNGFSCKLYNHGSHKQLNRLSITLKSHLKQRQMSTSFNKLETGLYSHSGESLS